MFQHHLLLAYRNFKRYKSSFFINLIGLSAGLCCTIIIYLWVNDELQMDRFHQYDSRLYQIMENEKLADGIVTAESTSGLLATTLASEMPEVEYGLTASPTYWLAQSKASVKDGTGIGAAGKFASADFFKVFSYPLLSGNTNEVLKGRNGIVISESLAKKLFHSTEVLGKEMVWRNPELQNINHCLVTGVFKDIPANSSDHFDFLVTPEYILGPNANYAKWGNRGPSAYIVLKEGTDPKVFESKIKDFLKNKGEQYRTLFMRPFHDGYLYGKYENGKQTGGRIDYVALFSLIAVFILLIACINFMNLSTAKASRRMKEVGIKKVMGVRRGSLIVQYLSESTVLAILALFVAMLFAELFLPAFNRLTDKDLAVHFDWRLILGLSTITLFTGLVAGSYPAFYISGFNPAAALKGKISNSITEVWTRKGLVVFQFTLSIVLIVSVFVIYKQIEFVQTKNLGFKRDHVINIDVQGKINGNSAPFIDELKKIPGVVHVSGMDRSFLGEFGSTVGAFNWEGRDPKEVIKFQHAGINDDLVETLGMQMVAGRSFSARFGADSTKIMINESGIRAMRLKNPVGKIFNLWGQDYQIVGIVKDFNFESIQQSVKPLFFYYAPKKSTRILVRIAAGEEKATIGLIRNFYTQYNPGFSFEYRFLDQDFQAQYTAENRVAVLSKYFAGLAIVISCLGLFGLAAFTAERKQKEIGIRKVLGATEMNIIYVLSKEFIMPVVLSVVIALPLSYLMARYWLDGYAYRISLQAWYFAAAALLSLCISWLTVGLQAFQAARVNPIVSLKSE
ncbi:ABC transporter permease [Pedobacter duraquae]|uniref:FtsX-like permease family protein n=1 Tax=Pedobacter duraquae TaxID=425511 RepID=A0A4R6IHL4_9SPHI|nr:ABC transporter permease [Pedobacter duraquae]TDO20655.1 FtsX-like permease family protein [Pedobacter duraquae]